MEKINARELKDLFIEIKYGNKIAFEKLYNNYNKLIYRIAYSILKNKQDAEDVVQIVFEKLYLTDKEKLPNRNESSWLYSITKNETINYLKRNKNNIDLDSIYNIEDDNNEINKIIDQDNYNRLISKLNNKEKEIISLKIISNLSFEEIGKLLKEPTGTIKWRYYKAVNTLKILLSNLGMFIITFVIGIKTLFNKKASDKVEQDKTIGNNTTEQTGENTKSDNQIQETEIENITNNIEETYNGIITNINSNSIVFEDKLRNKKYSIDVNSSLNFINGRTNEKVYYDEMKIGYYIDTYTYKKSKAISILSNIKGEELRKELIKNLTLEDSPYLTVSPIGTNIEIINSNKAILTITFEDLIPDYNVDGGKFEMKVEINSNTVIERKGGRNKIEQLKDADLNIIKIRLDKNTINNEIPIATYFMSSDGN